MQEVIVYRNPMEAAFWNLVMSGEFFPVLVGVIVFFAVFFGLHRALGRFWSDWGREGRIKTNVSLVVGIVAGVATVWKMWI